MKSHKFLNLIVLAIFLIPLLAACNTGPSTVDVALTTYKIVADKTSVRPGLVTFHVHNDATDKKHEFVVFKTDLPDDKLPLTSEGIVDEEGVGVTHIDEKEDIEPGKSVDLTVDLKPGNYVLLCNIDSKELHYQHGMHTSFVVK